jgi:hypothetical protein
MAAERTDPSTVTSVAPKSTLTSSDGGDVENDHTSAGSIHTTKKSSARPGQAGRTNYEQWEKVTKDLVHDVEQQDVVAEIEDRKALGLDGRYAASHADAVERTKAKDVQRAKRVLDNYVKRESAVRSELKGLLGPPPSVDIWESTTTPTKTTEETQMTTTTGTSSSSPPKIIRVTRDMIDAGKRVVNIADTSGSMSSMSSRSSDTIVLTSDLSLLESTMKTTTTGGPMGSTMQPKNYPDDAENDVVVAVPPINDGSNEEVDGGGQHERKIYGLIKIFLSNIHNCTVLIKCKVISGTLEMNHCTNVIVKVEKDATIATVQVDICKDISIQFHDAPSGKNIQTVPGQKRVYWGEDREDRIFHAGVSNMRVQIYRDGYVETERMCDYVVDGAKPIGNAKAEEFQFVTSCNAKELDGALVTEAVVREGATTGSNARPVTRRELDEQKEKRDKAASMAVHMAENMIKFKEVNKEGTKKVTKKEGSSDDNSVVVEEEEKAVEEEVIEEVYASMSKDEIDAIVKECELNKTRGNEAFGNGEYGQAILLYTLALDKADELPDVDTTDDVSPAAATTTAKTTATAGTATKQLFGRDVTLSNRAACFLKMGQHEKAAADAKSACDINPGNVKALFRHGLALHAMKQYASAIPILAQAHKLEPKNKQIKEALQFAEVRMNQDLRKRMEG